MIKKYLAITSSLVFIVTTGIICPLNTKAIEDIEPVEVVSMRSEYEKHYDNDTNLSFIIKSEVSL